MVDNVFVIIGGTEEVGVTSRVTCSRVSEALEPQVGDRRLRWFGQKEHIY